MGRYWAAANGETGGAAAAPALPPPWLLGWLACAKGDCAEPPLVVLLSRLGGRRGAVTVGVPADGCGREPAGDGPNEPPRLEELPSWPLPRRRTSGAREGAAGCRAHVFARAAQPAAAAAAAQQRCGGGGRAAAQAAGAGGDSNSGGGSGRAAAAEQQRTFAQHAAQALHHFFKGGAARGVALPAGLQESTPPREGSAA